MDNSISFGISTLFASLIINKFSLNQLYFGPIFNSLDGLLKKITLIDINFKFFDNMNTNYFYILTILILVILFVMMCKNYNTYYRYNKLCLFDSSDINIYMHYIKKYKEFYQESPIIEYNDTENFFIARKMGISYEPGYSKEKIPDEIKINFNDLNYGASGYFVWKKRITLYTKNIGNKVQEYKMEMPYIEINVRKKINQKKYFKYINKNFLKNNKTIKLYHINCFSSGYNDICIIYEGVKQETDDLDKIFMKTFFHKNKKELCDYIKSVHFDKDKFYSIGQFPQVGLILYGPPGTGKSTFAFRIARILNRHVISINFKEITLRKEVFQIFKRPFIDGCSQKPNDVVIIIDEFDTSVEYLYNKKINGKDDTNKNKDNVNKDNVNKDNDKKDNDKKDKNKDGPELELDDLLEIFQGPVPLEGAIIIATTNKLEEIQKMCPALFRPGRLTPIKFDYADNWMLNKMCKLYYKKKSNININNKNIQSSLLINFILKSKTQNKENEFEYFEKQLKSYLIESHLQFL
jgi:hypothetical protein